MATATGEPRPATTGATPFLAGLANYIDAGSIVAGAAALALWQESYNPSNAFVGMIAAFGPDSIGAGVGALIGRILRVHGGAKLPRRKPPAIRTASPEPHSSSRSRSTCRKS